MLCWRYFEVAVTILNQFPPSNRKFNIQRKMFITVMSNLIKFIDKKGIPRKIQKESRVCTKGTEQLTNPCKMQPSSVNPWCF